MLVFHETEISQRAALLIGLSVLLHIELLRKSIICLFDALNL